MNMAQFMCPSQRQIFLIPSLLKHPQIITRVSQWVRDTGLQASPGLQELVLGKAENWTPLTLLQSYMVQGKPRPGSLLL